MPIDPNQHPTPHAASAPADLETVCHIDEFWASGAMSAIEALAASGEIFSCSDLRDEPYSIPEPSHAAHWGALFSRAKTAGLIKPVGYAASRTATRNGGVERLWRGVGARLVAA